MTIAVLIPFSGAQFTPAVTLALLARGQLEITAAGQIIAARAVGGLAGVAAANLTFASELVSIATNDRGGVGGLGGELFATFGLVLVILVLIFQRRIISGLTAGGVKG